MDKKEKIYVQGDLNKAESVNVKKDDGFKEKKEEIDETLEDFYKNKKAVIEKPILLGGKFFAKVIILSIIFGLISGFFSSLFLLSQEKLKLPFFKEIDLRKHFPTKEINLVTEKKVTVIPDERILSVANDLKESVVDIFLEKSKKKKTFLSPVYLRNNALGAGFVLTTDGWVVTLKSVVKNLKDNYIILTWENKIYNVEKIIVDETTGVVFLKTNANNLKAVNFSTEKQNIGQTILLFDKLKNLKLAHLSNLKFYSKEKENDLVYSTEKLSQMYKIDTSLSSNFIGSPGFSLDRNIIGIVNDNSTLIPICHFKEIINQVLANGKVIRPYLGIDYLDLSEISNMIDSRYKEFNYGALVYGPPAKDSPADKAGIKNADLIIKVDNIRIDSKHNLNEVVQSYRPGDKIEITFLRNNKEKKVKLTLGLK